ncbi:unnamed protein product [Blepharisma stoltei]|uniref:Endoplasmic reticulum-Golgi intermediate compartment protein 3 n=1 Tax=Blepharisma stoltei TaxID=1481888 RepID=A0AAU9IZ66_9CILI|nr:unnamed protein product [Blepharisma stoltei]
MFSETVKSKIKKFDVYRKLPQDLTEPTLSGAFVSIIACAFMTLLFLTELAEYLKVSTNTEMFVDINRGGEKLVININIAFPRYPCGLISLDAQDIMGSHVVDVGGSMKKIRLSSDGKFIEEEDLFEKEHKEESGVNLQEIKKQLDNKEGCQLIGHILVNKVPGNFHVSSHAFHNQMHSIIIGDNSKLDLSHVINHLSFGSNKDLEFIKTHFEEGVLNPLDELKRIRPDGVRDALSYEYYIKVVPTTYQTLEGEEFFVHQFTANTNEYSAQGMPAVFFRYDLSPVTVKFSQTKESFFHFIVQVCAIVGGVFTVAGLIDNLLHTSISKILRKRDAGKLG